MPALAQVIAPTSWACIDFISDLHLGPDTPRTWEAWRDYMLRTPAPAVFILGDLFEAWVGDDARSEGFEAQAAALLGQAAAQRSVSFMVGNRDFLLGAQMLQDCGVHALADPTRLQAYGQCALLTHGDLLCTADVEYQQFRAQVRDPAWQQRVLARPLAERRLLAHHLRSQSEQRHAARPQDAIDADPDCAARWMAQAQTPVLVHGHTHRPMSHRLTDGRIRHVLSDWDLDDPARPRAQVLRWHAGQWSRLSLLAAVDPRDPSCSIG